MVSAAYMNPTAYGDLHGTNYAVWLARHLLADLEIHEYLFHALRRGNLSHDQPHRSVRPASHAAALPAHGLVDALRPAAWVAFVVRRYPLRLCALWNARVFVPQAAGAHPDYHRYHSLFCCSFAFVWLRIQLRADVGP